MKLIKSIKGLSKLLLIILLTASLILGAFLSYLMVMGYYFKFGVSNPKNTTLSISRVDFSNQSTSYFNVTFLTPYYSPSDAKITSIAVTTADNKIHSITQTSPELPYPIPRAQNITLQCTWNWANYTGQNIGVIAFIDGGSGPTYETAPLPLVGLRILETRFNSSISFTHFNLTIQNSQASAANVTISQITLPIEGLSIDQVSPALPYNLETNKTQTFKCSWEWSNYQNKSITIVVQTTQGYTTYSTTTTPKLDVEITSVHFSEPDITHFNVTVRNSQKSSTSVNINKITLTLENGTEKEIDKTQITPVLPYKLNRNFTQPFECLWNWTHYRGKNVIVSIFTAQNYTVRYSKATPSPIEITDAIFDVANMTRFSVIVRNSALYYTFVRITNITLTFENGTVKEIVSPQLPFPLQPNTHMTFTCPWNWTGYQSRNVTITVKTEENGVAQFVEVIPKILAITSITFDSTNTYVFDVTVRNSAHSLESANITKITVTFENGTVKQMSNVAPSLPYLLNPGSTVTFACQWDWTNYRGRNVTITVYAEKGYVASSLYTTPPPQ